MNMQQFQIEFQEKIREMKFEESWECIKIASIFVLHGYGIYDMAIRIFS